MGCEFDNNQLHLIICLFGLRAEYCIVVMSCGDVGRPGESSPSNEDNCDDNYCNDQDKDTQYDDDGYSVAAGR